MKIVVAVDGSKYSKWAVEWVDRLPFATSRQVAAVHVVDDQSLHAPLTPQPVPVWNEVFIQKEIKRRIAEGKRIAKSTRTLLTALRLKGKVTTTRGPVVPTLLNHVKGKGNLLVLGSRGLTAVDRFLLGSVSTKIIHQASCSVLIVKEAPRHLKHILFATDGSKSSEKALSFLIKKMLPLTMQPNKPASVLEVTVMHAMPYFKYPELKAAGKVIVQQTEKRLTKAGYQVREMLRVGQPAEQILGFADRSKVDLIVMGARGLGTVSRFFLGSVSTKLVHHSPCSVLIVR